MSYCCTRNQYLLAGSIVINMGDSVINTCWERPSSGFKPTVLSLVTSSCGELTHRYVCYWLQFDYWINRYLKGRTLFDIHHLRRIFSQMWRFRARLSTQLKIRVFRWKRVRLGADCWIVAVCTNSMTDSSDWIQREKTVTSWHLF